VNFVIDVEHVGNEKLGLHHAGADHENVGGMRFHLDVHHVRFVDIGVTGIVLNNRQNVLERSVRNENRANPILNKAAGKRHDAVALDGLGHHFAGQQTLANDWGVVEPQEMFAAPARLHSCIGGGDIVIERFRGFGLEIHGETDTGGNDNQDGKVPDQLQSAPTGFLAAAATTSR